MDKLKGNAFWVGIGGAGAVLLLLLVFMWYPSWSQAGTLHNQINSSQQALEMARNKGVPGSPAVDAWNQRRQDLEGQYNTIVEYYKNADASLESWFGGLPNPPAIGAFLGKFNDEHKKLEDQLKGLKIKVGVLDPDALEDEAPKLGFNWEEIGNEDMNKIPNAERAPVIRLLQKRFWIRKRIAEVAMKNKVQRIVDVRFFDKLHKNINQDLAMPLGFQPYPNDPKKGGGAMRGGFAEWILPDRHGQTIAFGFTIEIMYGQIPQFVREFLQEAQRPQLLVTISGLRTYLTKQNDPTVEIPWKQGESTEEEVLSNFQKGLKPPAVTVQFTCRVIDYDSERKEEVAQPETGQ